MNYSENIPLESEKSAICKHHLFVCSANTCRSPLAAVIMRNEVARRLGTDVAGIEKSGYVIRSAGPWARPGAAITHESQVVLAEMGYPVPGRGARELNTGLIMDSAQIYAMTRWHIDQVLEQVPEVANRVRLLDPRGIDIEDPIGGSIEVYRTAGRQIQQAVQGIVAGMFNKKA
jgi:L-threonylcarbamoyladenylate synthase